MIAILDTGVDHTHPAFAQAQILPQLEIDDDLRIKEGEPHDPAGHGTAVAGLIHQIAPEAILLPIRVLTANLRQSRHEIIRAGARAAIHRKATILNCSFGVPATPRTALIYKDWLDQAFDAEIKVVAANQNIPEMSEWPCDFRSTYAIANLEEPSQTSIIPSTRPMAFQAEGSKKSPGGGYVHLTGCLSTARFSGHLANDLAKKKPYVHRPEFHTQVISSLSQQLRVTKELLPRDPKLS